ncbi:GDP-mannose 4,6-dehydratase [Aquipseudomonas alcaligenes]|uniref:GDP-4-dehydro-6-deoxy-D-mannose reductase n=1 Tax=Aquipseudomonas alcaligenes TaxID=43263 RepID=A0A1N6N5C2_AQUAC|nr:GDP-mannose 4,6-dehydratase [Pseudomonas alcaligenes]SIP87266.1 GDP-4-dehydro-6-deoxy-D-mannose reductase [Pseudomonas alcaligenes]
MKKALLVTGLGGFVGGHIRRMLANDDRWRLLETPAYDLLDPVSLDASLRNVVPDAVIHLAAQTFIPESVRDPEKTLRINVLGTLNLLQALKRSGFTGALLYVSSGDIYGQVAESQLPIKESRLPAPRNPYAVSKCSAELLCLQWSYMEPWRMMVARPFNHIGSGQAEAFVIPSVARQLVRIGLGLQEPVVQVGDVDVTRDFLDVRDVIRAYLRLLDAGRSAEIYNVCSGVERNIRQLVQQMAVLAGVEVQLVQDAERLRRAEQRRVLGCSAKLQRETGWKPAIAIEETLQSVLADWGMREIQE